jgi:hypothetical protein
MWADGVQRNLLAAVATNDATIAGDNVRWARGLMLASLLVISNAKMAPTTGRPMAPVNAPAAPAYARISGTSLSVLDVGG